MTDAPRPPEVPVVVLETDGEPLVVSIGVLDDRWVEEMREIVEEVIGDK